MKCKDGASFKLSHFSIREAPMCTSTLKTGIVFVTEHKVEADALDGYNGLGLEAIQAKLQESDLGRQAHAFVIPATAD